MEQSMRLIRSVRPLANVRYWHLADIPSCSARIALATLVGFYPNVFSLTGRTFKSAFAQVRSSLNHADKPHRFTA